MASWVGEGAIRAELHPSWSEASFSTTLDRLWREPLDDVMRIMVPEKPSHPRAAAAPPGASACAWVDFVPLESRVLRECGRLGSPCCHLHRAARGALLPPHSWRLAACHAAAECGTPRPRVGFPAMAVWRCTLYLLRAAPDLRKGSPLSRTFSNLSMVSGGFLRLATVGRRGVGERADGSPFWQAEVGLRQRCLVAPVRSGLGQPPELVKNCVGAKLAATCTVQ